MEQIKKIWKFLSSMKFAVILLLILAAACTGGSFITQGQSYEWYAARYSERTAAAIMTFALDDVFHSWWFVLITLFLCLNLLLCNVIRFPALLRRWRREFTAEKKIGAIERVSGSVPERALAELFSSMAFHAVKDGTDAQGQPYCYAARHKAGIWGAWVCHLGILILIAGFGMGQMMKREYTAYGVPGQSRVIGDTGYVLTIDDFHIDLREDDTVEQYTADLTVRDVKNGTSQSKSVSVNHPQSMYGMKFYQNSTGWAAAVTVLKDGEQIQQEVLCAGEYLSVEDKEGLAVLFSAFYPDYYRDPDRGPMTKSSQLDNPGYLYRAYYMDQVIGMNVLTGDDVITIDEYTVIFSDPQPYTLIQIKRAPFTPLAMLGGLVVMVGLLLAFYIQPAELWALRQADGSWMVTGKSPKGGALFEERLAEAIRSVGGQTAKGSPAAEDKEQIT